MNNSNENRDYFNRYSTQDQYSRYSKERNIIFNRQYFNQNNSNYRNQNTTNRFLTQTFAINLDFQQFFRTSYQYDKEKQNVFQFKFTYASYDIKFQISRSVQSQFDQRQKAYYEKKNDYQKYTSNFSDNYKEQENVYNDMKKAQTENTLFLTDDLKNEFEKISQNFFVDSSTFCNVFHRCRKCENKYYSNNKLHKHLKNCRHQAMLHKITKSLIDINTQMINFNSQKIASEEKYEIIFRK